MYKGTRVLSDDPLVTPEPVIELENALNNGSGEKSAAKMKKILPWLQAYPGPKGRRNSDTQR